MNNILSSVKEKESSAFLNSKLFLFRTFLQRIHLETGFDDHSDWHAVYRFSRFDA